MIIYICNIGLLLVFAMIFLYNRPTGQKRKIYVWIASIQWILLSGLRHISIGADTYEYYNSFKRSFLISWKDAITAFKEVILGKVEGKDPGYIIFEKLCGSFTDNYQVYLIIIAVIFTGLMGYFIYANSRDPFISFLIYSCLFYAFFAITGIRQTIATAFTVFIGFELIKRRKLGAFILIVLTAATIHKSALVFLPFYFLYNININLQYKLVTSGIVLGSFVFKSQLSAWFKQLAGYDEYGIYEEAGTNTFTLLLILMVIVSFILSEQILNNNKESKYYYNALMIALFFVPLTYVNPSAMRVVQYYSIFMMFMIPEIICAFKERDQKIAKFLFVCIIVTLFLKGNPNYLFFWQGNSI